MSPKPYPFPRNPSLYGLVNKPTNPINQYSELNKLSYEWICYTFESELGLKGYGDIMFDRTAIGEEFFIFSDTLHPSGYPSPHFKLCK